MEARAGSLWHKGASVATPRANLISLFVGLNDDIVIFAVLSAHGRIQSLRYSGCICHLYVRATYGWVISLYKRYFSTLKVLINTRPEEQTEGAAGQAGGGRRQEEEDHGRHEGGRGQRGEVGGHDLVPRGPRQSESGEIPLYQTEIENKIFPVGGRLK